MSKNPYTESNRSQPDDNPKVDKDSKQEDIDRHARIDATGEDLRTNQGVRIADDHNQLKAGERGPTLMEDFIFREKLNHFDNERIPERVVHARGAGAHGYFTPYDNAAKYSKAAVFRDPSTPVFTRFSTVQGSRGSNDTVRDVRGFATKFYTSEGNWDLVGNDFPVFFIQDAIKFPDLVHAVKPEPHNEIPQGQSAHDTFWDFVGLMPETAHTVIWLMSDRAFPRHFRYMEGFGVHTFRLVDNEGRSRFVKFHWKPVAGTCSLIWDEAQTLWKADPDFNRREMWNDIENGDPLEFELAIQVVEEADEHRFSFDLLDPTKIIPEEEVPVERIGKLVLDRNPSNFFAETEQVAFSPGHIVPGIDFTNDPLLQGRLFSYLDTQMIRLQGPNFHEFPINRPVCPFANNQRDGMHRHAIATGQASYEPNSIDDGWPAETAPDQGGFESVNERVDAGKIRGRSDTFGDHYSQARLFWNSQTLVEQEHIIQAYAFELAKCERPYIRERIVTRMLPNISPELAQAVGEILGLDAPDQATAPQGQYGRSRTEQSAALSLLTALPGNIKHRKVAILAADGVETGQLDELKCRLRDEGATPLVIGPGMASLEAVEGNAVATDGMLNSLPSVVFDGVIVPGGSTSIDNLIGTGQGVYYLQQAYKHLKVIATVEEGRPLLAKADIPDDEDGVFCGDGIGAIFDDFCHALSQHRVWSRNDKANRMPA